MTKLRRRGRGAPPPLVSTLPVVKTTKVKAGSRSARRLCALPSCANKLHSYETPFCRPHWEQLPDDLQERVRWAATGESMEDYQAAIRAAALELRP